MNVLGIARLALVFMVLGSVFGCGSQAEIRSYSVTKPPARDQILAAMIPDDDQTWFFKMAGRAERLESLESDFQTLLSSVRFEDGDPQWDLPQGWNQQPRSGLRFATILVGSPPDLVELTVIPLGKGNDEWNEYLLANVNRWRGELGLRPLLADELATHTSQIELGERHATFMVARGDFSSGTTSNMAGLASGGAPDSSQETGGGSEPAPPKFVLPAGWRVAQHDQFSLLAFEAGPKLTPVRITMTPARGGIFANVNRWRTQMSLPPFTPEEMGSTLEKVDVGGHAGQIVAIDGQGPGGTQPAMLGVAVEIGGTDWYIKLKGELPQVEAERERFEQFLGKLRFEAN